MRWGALSALVPTGLDQQVAGLVPQHDVARAWDALGHRHRAVEGERRRAGDLEGVGARVEAQREDVDRGDRPVGVEGRAQHAAVRQEPELRAEVDRGGVAEGVEGGAVGRRLLQGREREGEDAVAAVAGAANDVPEAEA